MTLPKHFGYDAGSRNTHLHIATRPEPAIATAHTYSILAMMPMMRDQNSRTTHKHFGYDAGSNTTHHHDKTFALL